LSRRQIILDTETTGLEPAQGHRIIEIGAIELIDRKPTGNRFHVYLNPEREVDTGALEVHGLSNAFLANKPHFSEVAQDLVGFIEGTELIIHNAPFDVGFLNHELNLLGSAFNPINDYCDILDTLVMARKKHPGQRNSLDALCKRYGINNQHRSVHGALLDAEILAEVYLAMTGGQTVLMLETEETANTEVTEITSLPTDVRTLNQDRPSLKIIHPSASEMQAHVQRLAELDQASGGHCLWLSPN
jgi:DNA polymerase-3 subunit epsilon